MTGFSWDENKRAANVAKHGVDFTAAAAFDFDTALILTDERSNYGETREIALGFIGTRLHVLVFTRRDGAIRVIGLRKANSRERNRYEKAQKA